MKRNKELLKLLKKWMLEPGLDEAASYLCGLLRLNPAIMVAGLGHRTLDALIDEQPLPPHSDWYFVNDENV